MTARRSPRSLAAPSPRGIPVPRSNARVRVQDDGQLAPFTGDGRSVQVLCGDCEKRLFDATVGYIPRLRGPRSGWMPDGSVKLVKVCRGCSRKVAGWVTANPGEPYEAGAALAGPWLCECGKSLGFVDAIRGRVRTTCRCGTVVAVNAGDAVAVQTLADLPPLRVPTDDAPTEPDPFDDVPF